MLSKKTEEIYKRSIEYAAKVSREEGRAEGKAEGRAEGEVSKAMNIAKALKAKGMSLEEIVELTGLTEERVKAL